jgi:hypothetical protein
MPCGLGTQAPQLHCSLKQDNGLKSVGACGELSKASYAEAFLCVHISLMLGS